MFDVRWQVCGVICGTNGRVIDGAACGLVRRFVDRFGLATAAQQPQPQAPAGSYETRPAVPPIAAASDPPLIPPLVEIPPPGSQVAPAPDPAAWDRRTRGRPGAEVPSEDGGKAGQLGALKQRLAAELAAKLEGRAL